MSDDSKYKAPIVIISVDSGSGTATSSPSLPTAKIITGVPNTPPVVDFSATPQMGLDPLTVAFTDLSTNNPISWQWDFENNGSIDSTLQNPTHVYSVPGTYSVKLTVSNSGGSSSTVKTNYIVVEAPTDFLGDQTTVPVPLLFGNNVFSTDNVPVVPVPLLFGNNVFSTDNIINFPVSFVMPVPVVDFTANITSGNTPLTVNFTDQSTNTPIFWYWDFGDGAVSESQNPTHVYNNPGVYTVTLTASNTTGSATTTKVNYINVTVPVAANANIVLVPTLSAMTYASSYLAAYPTAIEVGGTFDTSQVGTGITFTTDTNVVIDTTYTNIFGQIFGAATAIGTTHTAYGNIYVAEFRIIAVGKTNFVQVGMFIQAYGPLFDPNTQFGGPLSSYYSSTGIIYGYGSGATVNADTYTDGDVIGMVMGVGFGQIAFFKNGVLQTELANMSNSDGYVMAGT